MPGKFSHNQKQNLKRQQKNLHDLTPEEKGYLIQYIKDQKNTIYVGIEDGIMNGLVAKGITYRASIIGDYLIGFAFNLQPWARDYLKANPHLLDGYAGRPMTPQEKLYARF